MKILSATIIPPGNDAQWWRISNIAKMLKLEGCEVEIAHYIVKGYQAHKKITDIKKVENNMSYDMDTIKILTIMSVHIFHLINLLNKKYDLVYGNTDPGAFFCILGKLTRIPLIYDKHGIPEEFSLNNDIKISNMHILFQRKLIELLALRFSDKVVCVSKKMMVYLHSNKNIPIEKMIYATNGVDLDFFKPMQDTQKISELKESLKIENKFVFGYIGRLQKHQGVTDLVESANKIADRNATLIVVGGAESFIKNNVVFISEVPQSELIYYYSICDVLVLPRPSHIATEVAAPTKFAEYAAMGKPILTTDVGDASDFVRQYENGIVVENNSPETLAKGMLEFLKLSPDQLKKMGENSRKLAENEFDWRKISNHLKIYLEGVITNE